MYVCMYVCIYIYIYMFSGHAEIGEDPERAVRLPHGQ